MLKAVFKNPELEREMNENGYLVIRNFLNPDEVQFLYDLYKKNSNDSEVGCWNSLYHLPVGKGKEISQTAVHVLEKKMQEICMDAVFPVAFYITKNPNCGHVSHVHRDDTMFKEEEDQYRQCWIPLVDINKENGALFVVPKSHKLFTSERPMFGPWGYEFLRERLSYEFEFLYVNAGDLIVYFDKTLHGSFLNTTTEARPALQGAILHKDSKPCFTRYEEQTGEMEYYEVTNDFFYNKEYESKDLQSKYKLVDKRPYILKKITEKEVDDFYGKVGKIEKLRKLIFEKV